MTKKLILVGLRTQEDVNGEKLTVKEKMVDFWCRSFHGLVPIFSRFTPIFSRFVRDINGEKKNISLSMSFFTVSFSRFTPSRRTQTQNAAFFERKGPERKPWPRGKSLNRKKKRSQCAFLNAGVLERESLNRNLSWGFPLGNLLPKTRVLKHRVLEHRTQSALGTQRFRTLS